MSTYLNFAQKKEERNVKVTIKSIIELTRLRPYVRNHYYPLTNRSRGSYWEILARGRCRMDRVQRGAPRLPTANIPQYGPEQVNEENGKLQV